MALELLAKYDCDPWLYNLLHPYAPSLLLEVSIKTYTDGRTVKGRYTVSVLLREFRQMDERLQEKVFHDLGFHLSNFREEMSRLNIGNTDIIFGQDGKTGKVYFDYLDRPVDPLLVCYESTGRLKFYRKCPGRPNWLLVTDAEGKPMGVHIRINGDAGIFWYGIGPDYTTVYLRPV